jgi:hypothetical protein
VRLAAFCVGVALLTVGPDRAAAHENGKVELYVAELAIAPVAGGHEVDALVVDRDSGTPASGFRVTVVARRGGAEPLAPTSLEPAEDGHYLGVLDLSEGSWQLTVTADQGTSVIPAKASSRTFDVEVAADGSTASAGDEGVPVVVFVGAGVGAALLAGLVTLRVRTRG